MNTPQMKALNMIPGRQIRTRVIAGAAIVLLNVNMALAQQSAVPAPQQEPTSTPQPQDTTAAPQQQAAAPQATGTLQTPAPQVPFNAMLHNSHNPLDAYRGKTVSPPSMANSPRLNSLIRDGKLYLVSSRCN